MNSRDQRRIFRHVNGPTADKLQDQQTRRVLVLACVASIAAVAIAFATFDNRFWLLVLASLPLGVATALLNFSLRGIFELKDELLDEYQISVRDKAYKSAYGFTLVFLVVVATAAAGAELDRVSAFALAAFAFLTCALAPRMLLAWRLENSHGGD